MYTIRETKKSYIIETDGVSPFYGCILQGEWLGKVVIPKGEVAITSDKYDERWFSWHAYNGYNTANVSDLFSAIALKCEWKPKGSRAIGCYQAQ